MFAIDRPAVDAIFSPVTEATENKILKTKPTDTPIPISLKIKIITFIVFNSVILGIFTSGKINKAIEIDITILICIEKNDVEKNGELSKNAATLNDAKKNIKNNWYKLNKSNPGKANSFIITS